MIQQTYDKLSNAARLQSEIVTAGLPVSPSAGARFYGCLCNYTGTGTSGYQTIVLCYDDITAGEITTIDGVVAAHIPTPIIAGPLDVVETVIFNNLAIRNTNTYTSDVSTNIGYRVKTLIVTNTLDQTVTKQCQGSRDQSVWFNIGDPFTVGAGVTLYQTCETYFPYIRGQAFCTVAPTTGGLSMWVEKMGV